MYTDYDRRKDELLDKLLNAFDQIKKEEKHLDLHQVVTNLTKWFEYHTSTYYDTYKEKLENMHITHLYDDKVKTLKEEPVKLIKLGKADEYYNHCLKSVEREADTYIHGIVGKFFLANLG